MISHKSDIGSRATRDVSDNTERETHVELEGADGDTGSCAGAGEADEVFRPDVAREQGRAHLRDGKKKIALKICFTLGASCALSVCTRTFTTRVIVVRARQELRQQFERCFTLGVLRRCGACQTCGNYLYGFGDAGPIC